MRHLQFQHHNSNDDGKDTVAEGFESSCLHYRTPDWLRSLLSIGHLPASYGSDANPFFYDEGVRFRALFLPRRKRRKRTSLCSVDGRTAERKSRSIPALVPINRRAADNAF